MSLMCVERKERENSRDRSKIFKRRRERKRERREARGDALFSSRFSHRLLLESDVDWIPSADAADVFVSLSEFSFSLSLLKLLFLPSLHSLYGFSASQLFSPLLSSSRLSVSSRCFTPATAILVERADHDSSLSRISSSAQL